MIAFYYGLTGFACVWFYRTTLTSSSARLRHAGRHPAARRRHPARRLRRVASATSTPARTTARRRSSASAVSSCIGIGSLLLGVVLMVIWQRVGAGLLQGRDAAQAAATTWCWRSSDEDRAGVGLPDSATMPTVIAPDLSNLPLGEAAHRPGDRRGVRPEPRPVEADPGRHARRRPTSPTDGDDGDGPPTGA